MGVGIGWIWRWISRLGWEMMIRTFRCFGNFLGLKMIGEREEMH
jgi:hypothetical protein